VILGVVLAALAVGDIPPPALTPHQGPAMSKLTELLDQRLVAMRISTTDSDKIDQEIRVAFEKMQAVMISDMSGFTTRTQKRGIIGFLASIRTLQRLAAPIIKAHGGRWFKADADDLFVAHESPQALYAIAKDLQMAVKRHNADEHDDLGLSIGLGYGPTLLIGDEDFFGNSVNVASKLGEDVGDASEILLSEDFYRALADKGTAFAECKHLGPEARKTKFGFYLCQ
jgi:adenylate cyclase